MQNIGRVKSLASGLGSLTHQVVPAKMRFLAEVVKRWKDIVGPNVSAHSMPVSVKNGTLSIVVDDPAWSGTLSLERDTVRDRILAVLPGSAVHFERLKFFQGTLPSPAEAEKEWELSIDPAILSRIDNILSQVADPELRKSLRGYFIRINLKETDTEVKE